MFDLNGACIKDQSGSATRRAFLVGLGAAGIATRPGEATTATTDTGENRTERVEGLDRRRVRIPVGAQNTPNGRHGILPPGFAYGGIGGVRSEFANTLDLQRPFGSEVYLWVGLPKLGSIYVSRVPESCNAELLLGEEQPVQGSLTTNYIADMRHNWASEQANRRERTPY